MRMRASKIELPRFYLFSEVNFFFFTSYGPMGVAIINSTIDLIFSDRSAAAAKLESTLEGLIVFKIDNERAANLNFWKGANSLSIALTDFLVFVVQPLVATLLISEDLGISESEAEETRVASKKYGLKFNFETDDGRVDDITMDNAMLGKVCFIYLHANF
jgi:uncharacterized integral membrane protein